MLKSYSRPIGFRVVRARPHTSGVVLETHNVSRPDGAILGAGATARGAVDGSASEQPSDFKPPYELNLAATSCRAIEHRWASSCESPNSRAFLKYRTRSGAGGFRLGPIECRKLSHRDDSYIVAPSSVGMT